MDDMKAFEQQLAARLERKAGPPRPVDALGIAHSAMGGAHAGRWSVVTRWSRGGSSSTSVETWPSLSAAVKFMVAAAIVALFGGFLLAGVLTAPQGDEMAPAGVAESPVPSSANVDQMLAGMTVSEDRELGVIHVENDGYRDIYREPGSWGEGNIEVGADGTVWIIWPGGRFFRLGDGAMYDLEQFYDIEHGYHDIEAFVAGPDGTLWAKSGDDVVSFDLELDEWTPLETDGATVHEMAIGADGTIWATTDDALVQFAADGSTAHPWPPANDDVDDWGSLGVSDDGVVWLTWASERDRGTVVHFDGDEWHWDPLPSPVQPYVAADVGPDGTLWIAGDDAIVHQNLARLDDSGWTVFGEADGVQPWGGKQGFVPHEQLHAAPNGTVLVDASWGNEFPARCAGMGRFDGATWTEMPSPWCPVDIDIGPDGSLWALGPLGPLDSGLNLTVIRPVASETDE